ASFLFGSMGMAIFNLQVIEEPIMSGSRYILAVALYFTGASALALEPAKVEVCKTSFKSGPKKDKDIRLEVFTPAGKGPLPAILLVPESKSLDNVGDTYRGAARFLAERGNVVALVHFFDRTGHKGVNPNDIKEEDFRAWRETVAEAFQHVQ